MGDTSKRCREPSSVHKLACRLFQSKQSQGNQRPTWPLKLNPSLKKMRERSGLFHSASSIPRMKALFSKLRTALRGDQTIITIIQPPTLTSKQWKSFGSRTWIAKLRKSEEKKSFTSRWKNGQMPKRGLASKSQEKLKARIRGPSLRRLEGSCEEITPQDISIPTRTHFWQTRLLLARKTKPPRFLIGLKKV
jgi:hypothetical protein